MNAIRTIASLINEDLDDVKPYFAAVACVEHDGKWLLGLSTANDDRKNKWCFPGGGIKEGENVVQAACRECYEETGIRCRPQGVPFSMHQPMGVAFVHCLALGPLTIKHNREFSDMRFVSLPGLRRLRLYHNVIDLIRRCR